MRGVMCYDILLPIHKLNRRDHEIAVRSHSMSEDGGDAVPMMALALVLAERDAGTVHCVVILGWSTN